VSSKPAKLDPIGVALLEATPPLPADFTASVMAMIQAEAQRVPARSVRAEQANDPAPDPRP
jgi:hypothetical protein